MSTLPVKDLINAALNLDLKELEENIEMVPKMSLIIMKELVSEYKKFLAVKVYLNDVDIPYRCSPSPLIDQVWHLHLMESNHH